MGQLNVSYPVRPREYLTDGDRESIFFFACFYGFRQNIWVISERNVFINK